MDEVLRSSSLRYVDGWYDVAPKDVARFAKGGPFSILRPRPAPWGFIALATFHPVGFVRQAAVEALAGLRDGRSLPFVLLRLNDWVSPVRRAAEATLDQHVTAEFAPSMIAALPLLFGLEQRRRHDHSSAVTAILDLLRSPECFQYVVEGCHSDDRTVRRHCVRIAGESSAEVLEKVMRDALHDADPAIRVWAAKRLGQLVNQPWARTMLQSQLRDRSVQVRRTAAEIIVPELPDEEARRVAEQLLLDQNSSARWLGRILRLRRGALDFRAFYLQALTIRANGVRNSRCPPGSGRSRHTLGHRIPWPVPPRQSDRHPPCSGACPGIPRTPLFHGALLRGAERQQPGHLEGRTARARHPFGPRAAGSTRCLGPD